MVPRRIILSRKGFDGGTGKCPSPIFQDGTMFSIPIPGNTGSTRYRDLGHQGEYELPRRLVTSPGHTVELGDCKVHLDPDIRIELRPKHAKSECANLYLFGQDSASQKHLEKNGVGIGDLFLFFGLLRCAKLNGDSASFVPGAREKHMLWGWLQVGKIFPLETGDPVPEELKCAGHHPHLESREPPRNCIYAATPKLSLSENLDGAGIFDKYDPDLCLTTKDERGPSYWTLPAFFKEVGMTYHGPTTSRGLHTWKRQGKLIHGQSVGRGQEFVMKTDEVNDKVKREIETWLESIFKHAKRSN